MLCTFLPPRSHLIRQFVKRHLVTIRREQRVVAQWLRQYFCQDHGVRSVALDMLIFDVMKLASSTVLRVYCLYHQTVYASAGCIVGRKVLI